MHESALFKNGKTIFVISFLCTIAFCCLLTFSEKNRTFAFIVPFRDFALSHFICIITVLLIFASMSPHHIQLNWSKIAPSENALPMIMKLSKLSVLSNQDELLKSHKISRPISQNLWKENVPLSSIGEEKA